MEQIRIVAVLGQQLVMRAELDDAAADQHRNLVRVTHRRDAVRDEERGATLHDALQLAQDLLLGVGVDAGKSVIQDQDPGITDDRAGNGRALFLSAGESDAALADHGRKTGRELLKFAPDVRRLRRLEHLCFAGLRSTKRNILANRLAEEKRLLGNEADVRAQQLERIIADRAAVNQNRSRGCIVKPRDQIDQGRFSGAGRADDGETASGRNA